MAVYWKRPSSLCPPSHRLDDRFAIPALEHQLYAAQSGLRLCELVCAVSELLGATAVPCVYLHLFGEAVQLADRLHDLVSPRKRFPGIFLDSSGSPYQEFMKMKRQAPALVAYAILMSTAERSPVHLANPSQTRIAAPTPWVSTSTRISKGRSMGDSVPKPTPNLPA